VSEPVSTPTREPHPLAAQIGGIRGMVDSSLPLVAFVIANAVDGLRTGVICAVAVGVVVLVVRLVRREDARQAVSGFLGVAVAALLAQRTGQARNFFLPGLLINAGYGLAFLVSVLARWPVVGVATAMIEGRSMSWRDDPVLRRTFSQLSLMWSAAFLLRLAVQLPLYLADRTTLLTAARLGLGWPLTVIVLVLTIRVVRSLEWPPEPEPAEPDET
jgi:hypothetical protein